MRARRPAGGLERLPGHFTRKYGSAGLYGLGSGSRLGVIDVALGVSEPDEAADLVERVRVRSAECGGDELVSEHDSPFREPASRTVGRQRLAVAAQLAA